VKLLIAVISILSALFLYLSFSTSTNRIDPLSPIALEKHSFSEVTETEISLSNNKLVSSEPIKQVNKNNPSLEHQPHDNKTEHNKLSETEIQTYTLTKVGSSADGKSLEQPLVIETTKPDLPGKEFNFLLKLHTSTHHMIEGRATSDIGKIEFQCRLMPSNEVKLSIKFKQLESENIELLAYIDLANFTLELDGSDSVLNKDHKQVLKYATYHLQSKFENQYEGYDAPEHALMLMRMISYWSVSPEGYVHEKRSIASQ